MARGLTIERTFSKAHQDPILEGYWTHRTVAIRDEAGTVLATQEVHFPEDWSDAACTIVASHYFYGDRKAPNGSPRDGKREFSLGQLIHRVARTIAHWGWEDGYFATEEDAAAFGDEVSWLMRHQHAFFNSPVEFNVGLHRVYGIRGNPGGWRWDATRKLAVPCHDSYEYPQSSACFIQKVDDDMDSIMALAVSEAMLFKHGSGTGTDLSTLRSTREKITGGGKPSGPVSFLRIYDAVASVVRSGGKTRRAAKMNSLKDHHPDLLEFIGAKARVETMVKDLIKAGHPSRYTDYTYWLLPFQNANLSVRLSDGFMDLAVRGADDRWLFKAVTTGEPIDSGRTPSEILDLIALNAWLCGDPGVQYDDTFNRWHTTPSAGRINATNPCGEYAHIDDSACNLASQNLVKFLDPDGGIDARRLRASARIVAIAQDILVGRSSYPTEAICTNANRFRQLGQGICNVGSLAMLCGVPYDSREARTLAAGCQALVCGEVYLTSSILADHLGVFDAFHADRQAMLNVMKLHASAASELAVLTARDDHEITFVDLADAAAACWKEVIGRSTYGWRNAQATVIAPTGTIAFAMDAKTTSIEPEIALVRYKHLAGGGMMRLVNDTVAEALAALGYPASAIQHALDHIETFGTVVPMRRKSDGLYIASMVKEEHWPVFACSMPAQAQDVFDGGRVVDTCEPVVPNQIPYLGHVKMVASVQPFVSGAISKTITMPRDCTPDDIRAVYTAAWKLGVKGFTVYRDGSKDSQPVTTSAPAAAARSNGVPVAEDAGLKTRIATLEQDLREQVEHTQEAIGLADERKQALIEMRAQLEAADRYIRRTLPKVGAGPVRDRLPDTRRSVTHKFDIQGHEGYITIGLYPDDHPRAGQPGEVFITMAKAGSTVNALFDHVGTMLSMLLQSRYPLAAIVEKFRDTTYEPRGMTRNPQIPIAKSVIDYVMRWLGNEYLHGHRELAVPQVNEDNEAVHPTAEPMTYSADEHLQVLVQSGRPGYQTPDGTHWAGKPEPGTVIEVQGGVAVASGGVCPCGGLMVRTGTCERCSACGHGEGCS